MNMNMYFFYYSGWKKKTITNYPIQSVFIYLFLIYIKGCQANVIWQDQNKLNVEIVKDAFWDYVAKATQMSEDILQKIQKTEIGQEIKWAMMFLKIKLYKKCFLFSSRFFSSVFVHGTMKLFMNNLNFLSS